MTTTYRRYLDYVTADVIGKGHIQQMYQHVYPLAWWGNVDRWAVGGKPTTLTDSEASDIIVALETRTDGGPFVTDQQRDQGADWLERYGRRLDDYPTELVGRRPLRFRFPRCEHFDAGLYGFFLPVYTAIYDDGTEMDYVVGSWQSKRAPFERLALRQGATA